MRTESSASSYAAVMHRRTRLLGVPIVLAAALVAAPAARATSSTRLTLPQGGRHILGHYRVVAYYGGSDGPGLGILGSKGPEKIAGDIEKRAKQWRGYGLKVQPAMELIATVAQGSAGADGDYSNPISDSAVQRYLHVAHQHHMLLILDFQPGRATFIDQIRHFRKFLTDPWVSVALDPEWKMTKHQVPGKTIGHARAHGINLVRNYLAALVKQKKLPDKLLVVHQFTTGMLPDRDKITSKRGVEVTFHADGFGSKSAKRATWHRLAFPHRPFGAGFKLFVHQDRGLMTPDEVMSLRPKVDLISYQ
jgi:hypothetical protein